MKRIVLIGSSFGNLNIIRKLKDKKKIEITLITPYKFKVSGSLLPHYIRDDFEFSDISVNLEDFCRENKVKFYREVIKKINFKDKWIKTENTVVNYDILVFSLNNNEDNLRDDKNPFSKDIKKIIEKKLNILSNREDSVIFLGINANNIERAIAFSELAKKLDRIIKIIMVDENKDLSLPLSEDSRYRIIKEIKKNGITIYNGQLIESITEDKIKLFNEDELDFKDIIHSRKHQGLEIEFEGYTLNDDSIIEVDESFRVVGLEDVFAMGDLVRIHGKKVTHGKNHGRQIAEFIYKNILLSLKNKKLESFKEIIPSVYIVNLTKKKALLEFKGKSIIGRIPNKIKLFLDINFMDKLKEEKDSEFIN